MGKYDNDGFDAFDPDSVDETSEGMKQLRAALKKANERVAAQTAEITTLTGKVQRTTVKDVLTAKKANPAIGRFILADGVDVTDEAAVDEWLQENGSLFGYQPQAGAEAPTGGGEQPADEETSGLAEQYTRLQNAGASGQPLQPALAAVERMGKAESQADIQAALDAGLAALGAGGK